MAQSTQGPATMRSGLPNSGLGGSPGNGKQGGFRRLAIKTAEICGKPATFAAAVLIIVIWGISGPIFHFSDTWQLVINTGTTIVTFLMVFLIQATQNRDTAAIQLKLDELIMATQKARDRIAVAEDLSDEELESLKKEVKVRKAIEDPDDGASDG
jgi:low affinity Fe/Cu permease